MRKNCCEFVLGRLGNVKFPFVSARLVRAGDHDTGGIKFDAVISTYGCPACPIPAREKLPSVVVILWIVGGAGETMTLTGAESA